MAALISRNRRNPGDKTDNVKEEDGRVCGANDNSCWEGQKKGKVQKSGMIRRQPTERKVQ